MKAFRDAKLQLVITSIVYRKGNVYSPDIHLLRTWTPISYSDCAARYLGANVAGFMPASASLYTPLLKHAIASRRHSSASFGLLSNSPKSRAGWSELVKNGRHATIEDMAYHRHSNTPEFKFLAGVIYKLGFIVHSLFSPMLTTGTWQPRQGTLHPGRNHELRGRGQHERSVAKARLSVLG